jgi:FkbH-like protein
LEDLALLLGAIPRKMFESEVNSQVEDSAAIPSVILERFAEGRHLYTARTLLPWGEHCTECNWPACYQSCELYTPRIDGGCRLFVKGMVRVNCDLSPSGYILKIQFKQWGKLWSVGNLNLVSLNSAKRKELTNILVGTGVQAVPFPSALRKKVLGKVSYLRRKSAETTSNPTTEPDAFVLECYKPSRDSIYLTLTLRVRGLDASKVFQSRIHVQPGFNRFRVPLSEIKARIDLQLPFDIEVVPNEIGDITLFFGLMDFVKEVVPPEAERVEGKKWKCVIWDLDNTLWGGVLIEDGAEQLRVNEEAVRFIKETDERGILHSICSKNNEEAALSFLRKVGLEHYFLYPQITWNPKSEGIKRIAKLLNIGLDAIAFVDDQPFERAEVTGALPLVTVVDSTEIPRLIDRSECSVPVTEESKQRRSFYRQQEDRRIAQEMSNTNYLEFLRSCEIELCVSGLSETNLERVYELAQRTNQMNFSGTRYSRERLSELLKSNTLESFVYTCSDRFGSYGIVGFAVVEPSIPCLKDLMFSCRIQGKRVEHAVISHIVQNLSRNSSDKRDFFANYRPTEKNAVSGKVFEQLGFRTVESSDGLLTLKIEVDTPLVSEGIVTFRP